MKRTLADIDAEAEEARKKLRRLDEERQATDEWKRQEMIRRLDMHSTLVYMFNLERLTTPADIEDTIKGLLHWRDAYAAAQVKKALSAAALPARKVVEVADYDEPDDTDPQGRVIRKCRTTYSDGTVETGIRF